jgi:hypothetical protein
MPLKWAIDTHWYDVGHCATLAPAGAASLFADQTSRRGRYVLHTGRVGGWRAGNRWAGCTTTVPWSRLFPARLLFADQAGCIVPL